MTAPSRNPTEVLLAARRRDSQRKRAHVKAVVDDMKLGDAPITFAAVARAAKVSTWLVYAEGVREYITAAQDYQAGAAERETAAGARTSAASLQMDLELAHQDNRTLRGEVARLAQALRQNLGNQLDQESFHHLRARADDLATANSRLQEDNRTLTTECERLRDMLRAAEDDLSAARTSLRRMIRDQTSDLNH